MGGIVVAVLTLIYGVKLPLTYRALIPLSFYVVFFFVSSYLVYASVQTELDRVTKECTVAPFLVVPAEHNNLSSQRHTLVIDFVLDVRNKSTHGNSLELRRCEVDLPGAKLEYISFFGEYGSNLHYSGPGHVWKVGEKAQTRPEVKVAFLLPYEPQLLPQKAVKGALFLVDIHEREHRLDFSETLLRTEPIYQPT